MSARLLFGALALAWCTAAGAQSVAFTFDDGPQLAETPRLSPQERNVAMLDALARTKAPAALLVTCGNGADRPAGRALAAAWGAAGHVVGNHTMTHPDLNSDKVTLRRYQQEILDCDSVIRTLPGYRKWFRFTFLREGNTPDKRDGMRAFLAQQGYRNAHVTLDTSDWRLDGLLVDTLKKNPQADLEPIRKAYLAHVRQRAEAYRALARQLEGREIAQVILLHHNLINALWLGDVIAQFQQMGWRIESPEAAYADPVYRQVPERLAAGQSLLLSLARSRGLGRFPGWERLVDDGDFEVEALKAAGY